MLSQSKSRHGQTILKTLALKFIFFSRMREYLIMEYSLEAINLIDFSFNLQNLVGWEVMIYQLILLAKVRFWTITRLLRLNADWERSNHHEIRKAFDSLLNILNTVATFNSYPLAPEFLIAKVKT